MKRSTVLALAVGVLAGFGFASITAIEGGMARVVGALNASLVENLMAGVLSFVILIAFLAAGRITPNMFRPVVLPATLGGGLVIVSVAAVAWTISRVGVAAANMAMLFGQITLATFIDTTGFGGFEAIPLTLPRVAGLLLMGCGLLLVMPSH